MKKTIIIAFTAVISSMAFMSCGGQASLKTEMDSVAYTLGMDFGYWLKNYDSTLNVDIIAQGIKDIIAGKEKMSMEDAQTFMREYNYVRKPAKAKKEGEEFLAKIERENKNIKKTESGILYEVLDAGDAAVKATDDNDVVKVVYEGRLKSGQVFDSSIERGDTAEFALNHVIRGWTEGLKLIGKGGKVKLYIPSDLAYGMQGNRGIGPNEPLVFDVELIDVIPAETEE